MKRFIVTLSTLLAVVATAVPPVPAKTRYYGPINDHYGPRPLISQTVYQGQASVVQNPLQALKSPATILSELKQANQIPAQMATGIKVQNSDTLNAATDGQTIVLTSGLLNRLNTNDERAFVISHELSHIVLNHIGRSQVRNVGLSLLDRLFLQRYLPAGTLGNLAANLGINLYELKSARGYEYQADDLGVKLMAQTGYNPEAAIQVFKILQAAAPGKSTPEFLQNHPITESRIRALAQKYKLNLQ